MSTQTARRIAIRSAGFWLALAMVASQLVNALRVTLNPIGFSAYFGIALSDPTDAAWVSVYGLRALFLGSFAALLLAKQRYRELSWMAWLAVLMPLGDGWLAARAGAADSIVIRHAVIALVLVAAGTTLGRLAKRCEN